MNSVNFTNFQMWIVPAGIVIFLVLKILKRLVLKISELEWTRKYLWSFESSPANILHLKSDVYQKIRQITLMMGVVDREMTVARLQHTFFAYKSTEVLIAIRKLRDDGLIVISANQVITLKEDVCLNPAHRGS